MNKHDGSTLDSLLLETGELEEVNAMAYDKIAREWLIDHFGEYRITDAMVESLAELLSVVAAKEG